MLCSTISIDGVLLLSRCYWNLTVFAGSFIILVVHDACHLWMISFIHTLSSSACHVLLDTWTFSGLCQSDLVAFMCLYCGMRGRVHSHFYEDGVTVLLGHWGTRASCAFDSLAVRFCSHHCTHHSFLCRLIRLFPFPMHGVFPSINSDSIFHVTLFLFG